MAKQNDPLSEWIDAMNKIIEKGIDEIESEYNVREERAREWLETSKKDSSLQTGQTHS